MDFLERQKVARIKTIEMLEENFVRLGRPQFDPENESFWEFMEILVDTWHVAYPREVLEWLQTRDDDLINEVSLGEQTKKGLHKSFAIPMGLFNMIKAYWKDAQFLNKTFGRKFKARFPLFKNSNYT